MNEEVASINAASDNVADEANDPSVTASPLSPAATETESAATGDLGGELGSRATSADSHGETSGVAVQLAWDATGEPRVDSALALLAEADGLNPAESGKVLSQVYDRLHATLLDS